MPPHNSCLRGAQRAVIMHLDLMDILQQLHPFLNEVAFAMFVGARPSISVSAPETPSAQKQNRHSATRSGLSKLAWCQMFAQGISANRRIHSTAANTNSQPLVVKFSLCYVKIIAFPNYVARHPRRATPRSRFGLGFLNARAFHCQRQHRRLDPLVIIHIVVVPESAAATGCDRCHIICVDLIRQCFFAASRN